MKAKLHNLNFLKIIATITVLLIHYHNNLGLKMGEGVDFYAYFKLLTRNGQKAVELFFMLSGFFFCLTLDTKKSVYEFFRSKIIRLWPVLIFLTLIDYIYSLFGLTKFDIQNNVLNLFGLRAWGVIKGGWFSGGGQASIFWYVSALIWTLLIFFYCRKYFDEKKVNFCIAVSIPLCYSYLLNSHYFRITGGCPMLFNMVSSDMIRAIGGVGIGYLIGLWYQDNAEKINEYVPSMNVKVIATAFEVMSVGFIIKHLMFCSLRGNQDMIFIVAFVVAIMTFLCKKGFLSRLVDLPIMDTLARYSYSAYMMHQTIFTLAFGVVIKNNPSLFNDHEELFLVCVMLGVAAISVFTYHFVEVRAIRHFSKKLQ